MHLNRQVGITGVYRYTGQIDLHVSDDNVSFYQVVSRAINFVLFCDDIIKSTATI